MIDRPPTRIFSGRIVSHKFDPAKPGMVTFTVESRPFEGDPSYASDFYAAIGRFVVLWGRFEHHLEMILHTLIAVAATYDIQENMQIPFVRKAAIFRRIYCDCAGLSKQAKDADWLMTNAEAIGLERNMIIHSTVNGWEDADPPHIKLRNYQTRNKKTFGTDIEATLQDITEMANKAETLNVRLMELTGPLQRLAGERLQKD